MIIVFIAAAAAAVKMQAGRFWLIENQWEIFNNNSLQHTHTAANISSSIIDEIQSISLWASEV
jgi:hypothetical protein